MGMVAYPSKLDFQAMVHLNMLKDGPGVQLDQTPAIPAPMATPTTTTTSDPDWAQLAEAAIHNADLGKADPLPPAPEVWCTPTWIKK